ncbi:FctX [Bifidobacterium pseudolongum subsp. globosum]|nr:vWA domain-containing protein [Bifidobacterium pseudolongum]RYP95327.1 FctX [Bifidobacterium pseudolongum subsp. globosum]RYQ33380.1 FctX [Bifidobacterium pseudolongum subsp. globosum]
MRRTRRFGGKHGSDEPRAESGRRKSRLVAAFVAVAMTVGLAGAGVAAYGEDTTDQSQSATTAAQDATAAAEGVDAPQYAKRISKNDDGTYTLSMDVTGKSSESTEQQVVPLDIALVLDVSGSMNESIGGGSSTTRLQALKQAVTSFLSQVEDQNQRINDNTKKVQVALIKYAGDNSNTIGNQRYCSGAIGPITGTCYGEWRNYSQTVHSLAWEPGQLQQERDAVNALKAGGATRADFGLQHAVTQLNSGVNSGRPGAQKLTIFYSDGSPTSSDGFETTVADAAIIAAAQLKAGTSQVISIGAMSGANPDGTDNANKFMNYVSSNYPNAQSMSEPGARGEGTYYYAVSASTNLQTIFDKIISMVTSGTAYQDVTMTDTLSDYVEFSQPVVQNFGAELVIRDKDGHRVDPSVVGLAGYTITAHPELKTISISFPQGYALKDGYTYSLEYKIVPSAKAYEEYAANVNAGKNGYGENPSVGADDTGVSSAGQQGFLSNERATIDYRPRVNGEPQVLVEGTEYPHPVIQVDTTQFANLSIHKAWIATNPEPDKVTVDVTCKDAVGGECTGYPGIDISKSSNWTSTVLIPKADADRTYTVTEHALSGFRTYYTNREITIPADTAGEYRSTVTNYPVAINFNLNQIRVGKTVQGTDTNQDFTFTLSPVNAEGAVAGDKPFTGAELTLDDRFTNGTQVTGAFADTSITLPTPEAGQEATYTFNIAENAPSPSAGWAADTDAVTVTVTVGAPTAEGTIPTTVTYHYAADDADGTEANKNLAAFTNHWIAVSQLPLTGEGGATPLLWLVIGGGLGALALLTAGGVAIWRTRRLI